MSCATRRTTASVSGESKRPHKCDNTAEGIVMGSDWGTADDDADWLVCGGVVFVGFMKGRAAFNT